MAQQKGFSSAMDDVVAQYMKQAKKKQEADANHNVDDWHAPVSDDADTGSQDSVVSEQEAPSSQEPEISVDDVNQGRVEPPAQESVQESVSQEQNDPTSSDTEKMKWVDTLPEQAQNPQGLNASQQWEQDHLQGVEQRVAQPVTRSEQLEQEQDGEDVLEESKRRMSYQESLESLSRLRNGESEPSNDDLGFVPEEQRDRRESPWAIATKAQKVMQKELQKRERQARQTKKDGSDPYQSGTNGALLKPQVSRVRDVPKPMLEQMMVEFEGKPKNQTDALVAWVVCHSDGAMITALAPYLTNDQMDLIASWENNPQVQLQSKVDEILVRMQKMSYHMDTMELLLAHGAFDRLGFREEQPNDPRTIQFLEDGVLDTILRAEEQTGEMRYARNLQKGRPKK